MKWSKSISHFQKGEGSLSSGVSADNLCGWPFARCCVHPWWVSSALCPVLERWIDVHSWQSSSQYLSGFYQPMTGLLRRPSLLSGPVILWTPGIWKRHNTENALLWRFLPPSPQLFLFLETVIAQNIITSPLILVPDVLFSIIRLGGGRDIGCL